MRALKKFKADGSEDKDWLYNNFKGETVEDVAKPFFNPLEFDMASNQFEYASGKENCKCKKCTDMRKFSNASGGTNYYDPETAKATLEFGTTLLGMFKKDKKDPQVVYVPAPSNDRPATEKKMSTGAIVGWSVAGLAVATGLFFGIRALVKK